MSSTTTVTGSITSNNTGNGEDLAVFSIDGRTRSPLPDLYDVSNRISVGFLILGSLFILLMKLGFAQLEAGLQKHTKVQHVFMRNQIDAAITCVAYYALGFGFSFGEVSNSSTKNKSCYIFYIVYIDDIYCYSIYYTFMYAIYTYIFRIYFMMPIYLLI